jgi:hypothetical protein
MTTEEYNQAVSKIKELQKKVARYEKDERPKSLSDVGVKPPIYMISILDDKVSKIEDGVFEYVSTGKSEEWRTFEKLAKLLHRPTPIYFMDETYHGSGVPMIRGENDIVRYRKYDQLTPQQMKLSAEMVNKMIEIWNEYFKKANPIVEYIDSVGNIKIKHVDK